MTTFDDAHSFQDGTGLSTGIMEFYGMGHAPSRGSERGAGFSEDCDLRRYFEQSRFGWGQGRGSAIGAGYWTGMGRGAGHYTSGGGELEGDGEG